MNWRRPSVIEIHPLTCFFRVSLFLTTLLFTAGGVQGQCTIEVQSKGIPIPGAVVIVEGSPIGVTGDSGSFVWKESLDQSPVSIAIKALGYVHLDTAFRCQKGEHLDIRLQPVPVLLGGATVVGSLSPLRLKDSPIRTQVLSGQALRRIPADDATEAIDFTNGVRETIGCGVCGTNSIQINGLEGVYSLVLLDGMPLLGGLASAYALDGIPLGMIQQVEVIQGPASARFGSQAVGGVINIVLAPADAGSGRASMTLGSHGRLLFSANSAFGSEQSPWQLGTDIQRFTRRLDDNGDGFTDAPTIERGVLTLRKRHLTERRQWRTMVRGISEKRFGGALGFTESDRGLNTLYGERIDLLRIEGVVGCTPREGEGWRFQGGGAYHRQQSTYGTAHFNAEEWTTNVDALHSGWSLGERNHISMGASILWDHYRDETPADSDMDVWVPAIFAEYSGASSENQPKWTWIHGLRVERPSDQGLILAPRMNLKWAPSPLLDLRLNLGRGYRRVHLFTEEHAALDGSREVIQPEGGLAPESSWNGLLGMDWQGGNADHVISCSARAFGTFFTDRIYADYDSLPNSILYRNIAGSGWSRGWGLDLQWSGGSGLRALAGCTWQRSEILDSQNAPWSPESRETARPLEFSPNWTANLSLGYGTDHWSVDLTSQSIGTMKLPLYPGETDYSDPYSLVHLTASHTWHRHSEGQLGRHFTTTVGVKNLSNVSQPMPLLGIEDPFGEDFDASRVYSPIEGRRFILQLSHAF